MELGRFSGLSHMAVPLSTSDFRSAWYSCLEPSHHTTLSGLKRAFASSTNFRTLGLVVGACSLLCWPENWDFKADRMLICSGSSSVGVGPTDVACLLSLK